MKILMVCLGNICRSPLAEGIMHYKAQEAGLHWQVDSAGTGSWYIGAAPHRLSQKVALQNGIDIAGQKGRQFAAEDMLEFDKIYFMDTDNLQDAKKIAGAYWNDAKADLLLNELYPGENRNVPDPYYGGEPEFIDVFYLINQACDAAITNLTKKIA